MAKRWYLKMKKGGKVKEGRLVGGKVVGSQGPYDTEKKAKAAGRRVLAKYTIPAGVRLVVEGRAAPGTAKKRKARKNPAKRSNPGAAAHTKSADKIKAKLKVGRATDGKVLTVSQRAFLRGALAAHQGHAAVNPRKNCGAPGAVRPSDKFKPAPLKKKSTARSNPKRKKASGGKKGTAWQIFLSKRLPYWRSRSRTHASAMKKVSAEWKKHGK